MPLPSPRVAAVSIACFFFAILDSPAQNLVLNGGFEDDLAAIAGATGDGSASQVDSKIDLWNVDVVGVGDYSFLTTPVGVFPGNSVAGIDLARFVDSGGAPVAHGGSYHIDVIGAALGATNHRDQRLNSIINQSVSGLTVGQNYRFTYHYSMTNYSAGPREFFARIDPESGGSIDNANNIYNNQVTVGFTDSDPAGILATADVGMFDPSGYSTNGTFPAAQDLELTIRTNTPSAVSATTIFDETAGSTEAPATVNWQTATVDFIATSTDVRVSFYNTTDPFEQLEESEYHWRTAADGMGKHDIWFGNEVGLLLDDVSLTLIPEPGAITLLAATALFFLLRRSARKHSHSLPRPVRDPPKP